MEKVALGGGVARYDDIITTIRRSYHSLTESQTKVADYIVANSLEVLGLTISELARKVGVSDPTITRFCHALRLSGYPQLRKLLATALLVKSTDSKAPSRSGRQRRQSIPSASTVKGKTDTSIAVAASLIARADWVRVAGTGAAGKLAEIIGIAYAPVFPDFSSIAFACVDDLIAQLPLTGKLGVTLLVPDLDNGDGEAEIATILSVRGIKLIDLRSTFEATNHSRHSPVKNLDKENATEAHMRTLLILAGAASELLDAALAVAHTS